MHEASQQGRRIPESELLTRGRCEQIFGIVQAHARALGVGEVEAIIGAGSHALTRFANNSIHQNVAERNGYVSVRTILDGRTARATTNRVDNDSIRQVVEQAVAITKVQAPDPELLPLFGPGRELPVSRHFESTAAARPVERASGVAEAIRTVESKALTAAGIYSTNENVSAILNSRDVFDYYCDTFAQFSITAMGSDSSGWAKASSCDSKDLNPSALASVAARKAETARSPMEEAPGRYTVILEPAAVLDLLGQMFADFSATAIKDGRSFLVDRLGQKLFGDNIHIEDDVYHAGQSGASFDGEGVPKEKVTLVERGIARQVVYSRQAAHQAGVSPTGHGFPLPNEMGEAPLNIVIQGGTTSIEEMVASTQRGILVTRLWYIREVDPYEKIMTGMTRDGTFLIEDGRIVRGLRNFRFNQGLVQLLNNVETLGVAVRASGEEAFDMVVPAIKVRDFNFTEVTRF
jgi:PmbA protein